MVLAHRARRRRGRARRAGARRGDPTCGRSPRFAAAVGAALHGRVAVLRRLERAELAVVAASARDRRGALPRAVPPRLRRAARGRPGRAHPARQPRPDGRPRALDPAAALPAPPSCASTTATARSGRCAPLRPTASACTRTRCAGAPSTPAAPATRRPARWALRAPARRGRGRGRAAHAATASPMPVDLVEWALSRELPRDPRAAAGARYAVAGLGLACRQPRVRSLVWYQLAGPPPSRGGRPQLGHRPADATAAARRPTFGALQTHAPALCPLHPIGGAHAMTRRPPPDRARALARRARLRGCSPRAARRRRRGLDGAAGPRRGRLLRRATSRWRATPAATP